MREVLEKIKAVRKAASELTAEQVENFRNWADENAAQWYLDMVYDETEYHKVPYAGFKQYEITIAGALCK